MSGTACHLGFMAVMRIWLGCYFHALRHASFDCWATLALLANPPLCVPSHGQAFRSVRNALAKGTGKK